MKKRYIVMFIVLILWAGYATFRAAKGLIAATQPSIYTGDKPR